MWKWIAIFLAMVLLTSEARAQATSPLLALTTGDDSRGWRAVGRLNLGANTFCTGAMIADDLVLTAGHCLFDGATGRRFDAAEIEFLADWRGGRATAYRGVRQIAVHPDFAASDAASEARSSHDLALLRLDQPIRKSSITPFATGTWPRKGAEVGVVSYARNRSDSPSLEDDCKVLARRSGALILSCVADFGASGAPVFVVQDGVARIVSVVSAKAEISGHKVSIGTGLQAPLADLMAMLQSSDGVFTRAAPRVLRLSTEDARATTGAKFVRP